MNKSMPVIGLCLLIAACVNAEPIPPRFTADAVSGANWIDLCDDYYRSKNPAARDELDRRGALSIKDREALTAQRAVIGMNSSVTRCLYGLPQSINDTTTDTVRAEQWVYCSNYMLSAKLRDLGKPSFLATPESAQTVCGGHAYLYFQNGVLSATQNVPIHWGSQRRQ